MLENLRCWTEKILLLEFNEDVDLETLARVKFLRLDTTRKMTNYIAITSYVTSV